MNRGASADTSSLQISLLWNGALQLARSNGQFDVFNSPLFHCKESLVNSQYLNLNLKNLYHSPR
jgi:hypothetical protein